MALVEPPAFVRVDGLLVFDRFMARLYHAAIAEAELGYHVSYNAPTILIYILVHPDDYNNKVDIFRFIYIYIYISAGWYTSLNCNSDVA